jgi:hypothetical protein
LIMERFSRTLAMVALSACIATVAAAQQPAPPLPGRSPGDARPTEQQREEVRKKVEAVRLARLTEVLQLDEKTAAKFIPAVTAIDQKRRTLVKENQETLRELKIMLHAAPPDEAKLKVAIAAIDKNRREIFSLRDKEFAVAKDNLTVTQMARYILFNQEYQPEMRGMVVGARQPRRGGLGPGPGKGQGKGAPAPQQP